MRRFCCKECENFTTNSTLTFHSLKIVYNLSIILLLFSFQNVAHFITLFQMYAFSYYTHRWVPTVERLQKKALPNTFLLLILNSKFVKAKIFKSLTHLLLRKCALLQFLPYCSSFTLSFCRSQR